VLDSIPRKLTYEDYLLFPEDGRRHELIDGEHLVSPAPPLRHQRSVARLSVLLGTFIEENPLGEALLGPFDVILTEHEVVQPDLLFVSNERAAIWTEQGTRGAPDLVIEVFSPETRKVDETLKLSLYEREDVREYWMFDPERKFARVFRRQGDSLVALLDLSAVAGDVLETPLLPGLLIPLAKVFR
jgi:Uma2 family endonuclease